LINHDFVYSVEYDWVQQREVTGLTELSVSENPTKKERADVTPELCEGIADEVLTGRWQ
jgi:hypothetical protein